MAFPAGVILRPVTFGPAFELEDGGDAGMTVKFTSTRPGMLWRDTGQPGVSNPITVSANDGLQQTVMLPVTDQNGWGDGDGNAIVVEGDQNTHLYKVEVKYTQDGRDLPGGPRTRNIPIPTGDLSPLDLDKLIPLTTPGGQMVSVPDIWSEQIEDAQASAAAAAASVADAAAVVTSTVTTDLASGTGPIAAEVSAKVALVAGASAFEFGLSPDNTAVSNVNALHAASTWLDTNVLGIRTLFMPAIGSTEFFLVNDHTDFTTDNVRILGVGDQSRFKQTNKAKGILRIFGKNSRVESIGVVGADDRTTVDGGGLDLINDNHPFLNHVGVVFMYGSDGSSAFNITGKNINSVVAAWGWSQTLGTYGGIVKYLTFDKIFGENVWSVVFVREAYNISITRISGSYSRVPGIFADPHLIYVTSSNYTGALRPVIGCTVDDVFAYDSLGGEPVKLSNVYGGSLTKLIVRGTPGILVIAECDGITIGPYIADDIWKDPASVGTNHSTSGAQPAMLTFSSCKNVTMAPGSRQVNRAGDQSKAIAFASAGATQAWCENMDIALPYIETRHTTNDLADNRAEVYGYGRNVKLMFSVGSQINMKGAYRHGIRVAGPGGEVIAPNILGCAQAIITNGTGSSEIKTITITGSPTGGTFTATFGGQTTAPMAYNVSAADMQVALRALSSIGGSNVTVTLSGGVYSVTFGGTMATQAIGTMTTTSSLTGGTAPAVVVAVALVGESGAWKVRDYDPSKIVRAETSGTPMRLNSSLDTLVEVLTAPPKAATFDRGLIGSPSNRINGISSGEKPTLFGSAFTVSPTTGRWNCASASATLPRMAAYEKGSVDAVVESDVFLGVIDSGGSGTYSVGHSLRVVDEFNNLMVELRSDRLTVSYRYGSSGINVVSVASVTGLTHNIGRRYALRSVIFGDNVQVFLDGVKIIDVLLSATLTAPQIATLATGTKHGIVTRQSLASQWANFRCESLAA